MTHKRRHTREELRQDMRRQANSSRDTADQMALMYGGCDDPLHPWNLDTPWNNWVEFVDMVCRPLVEADGDEAVEQAAMAQYRKACPHYICVALVMAANRAGEIPTCPACGAGPEGSDDCALCRALADTDTEDSDG